MKKALSVWMCPVGVRGRWWSTYVGLGALLWAVLIAAMALIVAHGAAGPELPTIGVMLAVTLLTDTAESKVDPYLLVTLAIVVGVAIYLMVTGGGEVALPGALLVVAATVVLLRVILREVSAAELAAKNPIHMG